MACNDYNAPPTGVIDYDFGIEIGGRGSGADWDLASNRSAKSSHSRGNGSSSARA